MNCIRGPFCFLLVFFIVSGLYAEEEVNSKEVKIRYKMPSIVMTAHVDWPKDLNHWDTMAKFVVSNGFNVVEGGVEHLDVCRKHGLMVRLGGDQATLDLAPKLKNDPAVFGYFISDRRRRDSFPAFANIAKIFEKADPNHPTIFINRANWNEFGDFTKQVNPMLLDFYHYHAMPRRHPERYYLYLLMFRDLGHKNGIPVMRCTSSSSPPTVLRHTIYSSLAYGVRGFHFWVPWIFAHAKDNEGNAVLKDGKLDMYITLPHLTEVAKEVKYMSPYLSNSRSVDIYHTDPLPISGGKSPEDHWCRVNGTNFLLGIFKEDGGKDLILITNKNTGQKQTAKMLFDSTVKEVAKMNKKNGEWLNLTVNSDQNKRFLELEMDPGDGDLLKVTREIK
ncbi:MAG: hypothetical protein MK172_05100 [Verrucomicrobiales bacterium]|nr:hypothetical protein [Verrucomicrobiales bacterium]